MFSSNFLTRSMIFARMPRETLAICMITTILIGSFEKNLYAVQSDQIISEIDLSIRDIRVRGCDSANDFEELASLEISESGFPSSSLSKTIIDRVKIGLEEPQILRLNPHSEAIKCRSGKLFVATQGIVISGHTLPNELVIANFDSQGFLVPSPKGGVFLKRRSYRYNCVQRLTSFVLTGVLWPDSDHYELRFRPGSDGFVASAMEEIV